MESGVKHSSPTSAESQHLGVASFVHRRLKRLYVTALGTIALLTIACQIIVQNALGEQEQDAKLINVAGRQRMLSQKITKDALLLFVCESPQKANAIKAELSTSLTQWSKTQNSLRKDEFAGQGSGKNSAAVQALIEKIQPCFAEMQSTAQAIAALAEADSNEQNHSKTQNKSAAEQGQIRLLADKLVALEPTFLTAMDQIVEQYQSESEARVSAQRNIELLIFSLTLAALALEAWFIFRPAFAQVKQAVKIIENEKAVSMLPKFQTTDTADKEEIKRISEFYALVSHELRTPLTTIRAFFGLLEGGVLGELPPEAIEATAASKLESERLSRLVENILDVGKIQADIIPFKSELLSAKDLVEEKVATFEAQAKAKEIKLVTRLSDNPLVTGDRARVAQALNNLISNAIKFSPPKSTVTLIAEVTSQSSGQRVRFSVIDQGTGISSDDQKKLFKLFQQLDSSDARKSGGSGLGLAITKAIIEKQNGAVGVESEYGTGSTFWFELPRAKAD